MNAQDLKNSILQLAIQGKLVEQRPEEGTAEELYQQIQEEKAKLIAEGKIKKEKVLSEITEDEITFGIPDSWKWVRFSEVLDVRDGTHDTPKYVSEGIPLVTSKNLAKNRIDFSNVKLISMEDAEMINKRSGVESNDILFAMIGSIGNPVIVNKDREFAIKNMALFKPINKTHIHMEYVKLFLELEQFNMKKKSSGGVQSFVSLKFLRTYVFPVPPLEEQKRIVVKVEELLPIVERYGVAQSNLEAFNKKFPEDMQKSILQYAIQGKLVEQRPEEGTAHELYEEIQVEKSRLIAEGKIKKEKALSEITEDEIPFGIPAGWKWVRLGNLFTVSTGMTPLKTNELFYDGGDIPWITSSQTGKEQITSANNFVTKYAVDNTSLKLYPKHTLIIAMYGQGKTRGQISKLEIEATINQACAALENVIYNEDLIKYVMNFQKFNYNKSRMNAEGSAQPNLNLDKVRNIILPLPPLKEQGRIIKEVEKLIRKVNILE